MRYDLDISGLKYSMHTWWNRENTQDHDVISGSMVHGNAFRFVFPCTYLSILPDVLLLNKRELLIIESRSSLSHRKGYAMQYASKILQRMMQRVNLRC